MRSGFSLGEAASPSCIFISQRVSYEHQFSGSDHTRRGGVVFVVCWSLTRNIMKSRNHTCTAKASLYCKLLVAFREETVRDETLRFWYYIIRSVHAVNQLANFQ